MLLQANYQLSIPTSYDSGGTTFDYSGVIPIKPEMSMIVVTRNPGYVTQGRACTLVVLRETKSSGRIVYDLIVFSAESRIGCRLVISKRSPIPIHISKINIFADAIPQMPMTAMMIKFPLPGITTI